MQAFIEYVTGDFWVFLKFVVILIIAVQWKPFEINVLNGMLRGKKDEDDAD